MLLQFSDCYSQPIHFVMSCKLLPCPQICRFALGPEKGQVQVLALDGALTSAPNAIEKIDTR
jgi:hypothetical protein